MAEGTPASERGPSAESPGLTSTSNQNSVCPSGTQPHRQQVLFASVSPPKQLALTLLVLGPYWCCPSGSCGSTLLPNTPRKSAAHTLCLHCVTKPPPPTPTPAASCIHPPRPAFRLSRHRPPAGLCTGFTRCGAGSWLSRSWWRVSLCLAQCLAQGNCSIDLG